MSRIGKTVSWLVGVIALVIIAVGLFLAFFDWNRLKPTINKKVSTELRRPFAIRGDLGVRWIRPQDDPTWRRWVPWPYLHADDIVLGNPATIPGDNMVMLKRAEAVISPLALLNKTVAIPRIWLTQPQAWLQRLASGENNWTFNLANSDPENPQQTPSAWSVKINDIVLDRGEIHYNDARLKAKLNVIVDTLGKPLSFNEVTGQPAITDGDKPTKQKPRKQKRTVPEFVFGWQVDGTYKGQPLTGKGKIGGMIALRSDDRPFPIQADLRSGATHIVLAGTLLDPLDLAELDLQLRLAGHSLDQLYPLTGVLLPKTPPYATDGHLTANMNAKGGAVYHYQQFHGKIGHSDIHGNLTYVAKKSRPALRGDLVSKQLLFNDLAPLIGADTNQAKRSRGEKTRQPAGKVLPVEEFDTKSWSKMDADVKFTAKRIVHDEQLPITDLSTHLKLENGTLLLDPLRFGVAGGTLNSTVRLEGKTRPMRGNVALHARRFQLKRLFPTIELMQTSAGQINGDAKLRGRGNSVAALLGSANGDVQMLMNDGVISRALMELLGLNLGNYLVTEIFGDDEVKINCIAADVNVSDGVAAPRLFVFDTENATIDVSGNVNLASERMDLHINPESKGARILTLRSPLYVRGTFSDPQPGVEPGPLLARGAAAVALGVIVAPAAALLALASPSEGEESPCGPMLREMQASAKQ